MADFGGTAPFANLYLMWIGGNDLDDALTALGTDSTSMRASCLAALFRKVSFARVGKLLAE